MDQACWEAVASLLTYPDAGTYPALIEACGTLRADGEFPPEPIETLDAFLRGSDPEQLEEHFTRTFDVNPLCTLEIGWHLYGEDYARGAFLVEMRQAMRTLGVEEGSELPDHLPSVLRVLARLDEDQAAVFSRRFIQPALLKMIASYEETDAPYHHLLEGVLAALEGEYGVTDPADAETPATQAVPYDCSGGCGASPPQAASSADPARSPE